MLSAFFAHTKASRRIDIIVKQQAVRQLPSNLTSAILGSAAVHLALSSERFSAQFWAGTIARQCEIVNIVATASPSAYVRAHYTGHLDEAHF